MCNIQVSVHLLLKLLGKNICHRGDIPSSTISVFGLVHNMGRPATFVLGSTQLLHHFFYLKNEPKIEIMSCTRLYVGSTER